MKNNWNVEINNEGNLLIQAEESLGDLDNLFGHKRLETGLCIYAHELRSVRLLLNRLFPNSTIKSFEMIEQVIKEEFCQMRTVRELRNCLDTARIPYRNYSYVA